MSKSMPEAGSRGRTAGQKPAGKRRKSVTLPTLDLERAGFDAGYRIVAGIDEAGRGPWAGPVVAAAVILDAGNVPNGITDSKQLSEERREAVFEEILQSAKVGIGFADPERIDRDNILAATMWSMQRAAGELDTPPDLILIDGNRAPKFDCAVQTVVKGDARSLSIAAASIVAKVSRDRMMRRLDVQYPNYGFAQHKGYGTAQHSSALARFGITPLHRRSFKPVRDAIEAAQSGLASR